MIRALDLAHGVPALLLLFLLSAGSAAAQGEPKESDPEPDRTALSGEAVVFGGDERVVEPLEQKGGRLGYSLISVDGYGGRASEYGFLHSSRSGGLFYRSLEKDGNFELEGNFLNEHDYHGDLLVDYQGDYRLHLRTESLFHNTDRELLFSPPFTSSQSSGAPASYSASQDPPANYGVSVTQDLAEFRYRLHNFPLHVNLGYWRLVKEGTVQQRFADVAFEGASNTVYARGRALEHQTQEGHLGLDAHLGWVDLIYDFRVRVFEDRQATPRDPYAVRNLAGAPDQLLQHNEDPDSRFLSHTVKLHTSLAGGIVGSASYSIDQRENLSRLTDTSGAKYSEVVLQNLAGDFVYTPCKEFSLALKYRRQQLDNGDRGPIVSSNVNLLPQAQLAKPPVDSTKDIALATLSFKPAKELTVSGEYRGEVLTRNHVSELPSTTTWALPEDSATQKGSLALLYHPSKGIRVTAKYSYQTTDHPSYGTSFQQKHEGQFLATYTTARWGATANLTARREWNDQVEHFFVDAPFADPVSYTASAPLSRDRATENANLGVWFTPMARVTLSANYAYLHNRVNQGILFTGVDLNQLADPPTAANFTTRSQVYGVNASCAATEKLDLSLMLQQIRSGSSFTPQDAVFTVAPGDTSGIQEITRQDTVISSASARGEYRFTRLLSGSLEYTLQDYNEKNPVYSAYNGTVHAVVAYLSAKW